MAPSLPLSIGRARRGASGALNSQSAIARLNSSPRPRHWAYVLRSGYRRLGPTRRRLVNPARSGRKQRSTIHYGCRGSTWPESWPLTRPGVGVEGRCAVFTPNDISFTLHSIPGLFIQYQEVSRTRILALQHKAQGCRKPGLVKH